ncbi:LPXTG cell wall anchor domain-containing protein [Streptomyces sp. NPDC048606]|uniref:LPXTG cell wall anchor domain-containing protein n=1 Tax=Streptomyces sp. NPDC048606 TaxID=3154726 RepID=UPI003422549F
MTTRPRLTLPPPLALLGFLLVLTVQALALALAAAGPARAHGDTLKVVITGQREGRVTADITWENDGDPVEEAVAATVNAVSADKSRTVGPGRLVRDGDRPGGWTAAEPLPPGAWTVTVDVGFPALGHAAGEVSVPVVDPAPTATPTPTPTPPASGTTDASPAPASPAATATPPAPSDTAPATRPAGGSGDDTGWWTTAGVAAIALVGAAAGVFLRRKRR